MNRGSMTGDICARLTAFDRGDRKRIQHAFKVTGYAMAIAADERLTMADRRVLEAASILHDIGILPAIEQYGNSNGKAQEELGPAEARVILSDLNWCEADIRRVECLIGHHHTYNVPNDPLLQILIEADFIVNVDEGAFPGQNPASLRDRFFHTVSGTRLYNELFGLA